jgi:glycerophosphoryl diester phosphodiesterase
MMRRILTLIPGLALLVVALVVPSRDGAAVPACDLAPPVAHRGGAEEGYTENGTKAYNWARQFGVLRWDTDIQFDSTGTPVLMHDLTIDRTTTGTGNVTSVNFATTSARMDDGSRLPLLSTLLDLAAKYGAFLYAELKTVPTATQLNRVLSAINAAGMRAHILLHSFVGATLLQVHAAAPDIPTALIDSSGTVTGAQAALYGTTIHESLANVTPAFVADMAAHGVGVYAWTPDSPTSWPLTEVVGLRGVVTNRPFSYLAWREFRCRGSDWASGTEYP